MGDARRTIASRIVDDVSCDPLLREMRQFRAMRWIIAFAIVGILWVVGAFSAWSAWKAWTAVVIVFGAAGYFEVRALASPGNKPRNSPPSDIREG